MSDQDPSKDLIVLVADKDMEMAIKGILERPKSLNIRGVSYDIYTHSRHDPGCYLSSHSFLLQFSSSYSHSLVLFDREGCGRDNKSREELEKEVEERLASHGWDDRTSVIVLDPELEIWVWSNSPHVNDVLGWRDIPGGLVLSDWLQQQGFIQKGEVKPLHPKEAMEAAIRFSKKPKSPANFYQLAQRVGFNNCNDASFLKLRSILQTWFPII